MSTQRGQVIPLRRPTASEEALSEDGLIAACAAGDRAARAMLFERHVDAVHRFVSRMTNRIDLTDDLVQATFIAAYRAAATFRGSSTVRTWLCGIANNVVRTQTRGEIRRRVAMSSVADATAVAEHAVHAASMTETLERRRMVARLPDAIASLRHDLRAVFVLVDMGGERGADAAAALGIPEGSLWRRLSEARAALRAALGGAP